MSTKFVTITRQGQITIPKKIRDALGISSVTKATIDHVDGTIIVRPKKNFWSLGGSLRGSVHLSDAEMKKARNVFTKAWPRKNMIKKST